VGRQAERRCAAVEYATGRQDPGTGFTLEGCEPGTGR
jgi:hypothetical protein